MNNTTTVHKPADVLHEFCNFESAYRIGLLSVHTEYDLISNYKTQLEKLGYEVDWNEYPMEHSVNHEELMDISRFLQRVLIKPTN